MRTLLKLTVLALLTPALLTGCSKNGFLTGLGIIGAAGAGAAAIYYATGDVEADVDRGIDTVHKAALESLEEEGYHAKDEEVDSEDGVIDAENSEGKDIKVKLRRTDDHKTHVSIRAGTVGHDDRALDVWQRMANKLGVNDEVERAGSSEKPETRTQDSKTTETNTRQSSDKNKTADEDMAKANNTKG